MSTAASTIETEVAASALAVGAATAVLAEAGGTAWEMPLREAAQRVGTTGGLPLVCHAPMVAKRLGLTALPALDVLELYAFVRPARFCVPTVDGLVKALGLAPTPTLADEAQALHDIAHHLLDELRHLEPEARAAALPIAAAMRRGGWRWGRDVLAALGCTDGGPIADARALAIWRELPEWGELAPEPPPGHTGVRSDLALRRLTELTGAGAEERPQQRDYTYEICGAFAPAEIEGEPHVVIAEAGTGVGKTLGYVAPASLWAEENGGAVWLSTYTRNLQRQIDGECDRLFPDPVEKARKVVIRKGRENYLCLLNYEEAANRVGLAQVEAIPLGLVARWALATRDGDLGGGDFPSWLTELLGPARTVGLADRRGECIYAACEHYRRCFIERTVRRARRADLVVANHALVMAQAALGGLDDNTVPRRLVFDEGHHLFEAADGAFSAELSGREAAELRRWLLGPEEGRRRRARGLAQRIDDLAHMDERVADGLKATLDAARALPSPGWAGRIGGGVPRGPAEAFLALVRQQVYARAPATDTGYDLETETQPALPSLLDAADELATALLALAQPMRALTARILALLDERADELDTALRQRIDATARALRRRSEGEVQAWIAMLGSLREGVPDAYADWFAVERAGGADIDVGMHRHWVDPMIPFADAVVQPAHGVVVTSATLRDATGDADADWDAADARTGARHLPVAVSRSAIASPFDYPARTRVFVVTDVKRDDQAQVAAAFRELFVAAGGGALGLFTAIARLRAVHQRIGAPLEAAGIPLYAQHVDRMDTTTLIDIFRAEERACLLGTDAVRDGVDVPGRSLRLIVFDRVPWPRPTILHKARREAFTETGYDDMIARLRLKQAFGRLIRRADDRGVFVMLDSRLPSRLLGAFPPGVAVARTGLAAAIAATRDFLAP
jgi:ATP-dependent DNA helicase DinG